MTSPPRPWAKPSSTSGTRYCSLASGTPPRAQPSRTFFIGQCMRRYANVARRWLTHQQRPHGELLTDDNAILDTGRVVGVEDDAIRTVTAQVILKGVTNDRAARALAMDACGYRNAEIADDLGVSLDAASSLIKRARADIRKNHQAAEGGSTTS